MSGEGHHTFLSDQLSTCMRGGGLGKKCGIQLFTKFFPPRHPKNQSKSEQRFHFILKQEGSF